MCHFMTCDICGASLPPNNIARINEAKKQAIRDKHKDEIRRLVNALKTELEAEDAEMKLLRN